MADIEPFHLEQAEEVDATIRRFVTQGRAVIDAVRSQDASTPDLNAWYQNFCAGANHRFGALLYMYAKSAPGVKRDLVLGTNSDKIYGPRFWRTEGTTLLHTIYQVRQRNRRGIVLGALLQIDNPHSPVLEGKVKVLDSPDSQLSVDSFMDPFGGVLLDRDGVQEFNMSAVTALGIAVSAIESMPGILPVSPDSPASPVIDVPHGELPPS
ncbi:MAG: hypothetical protein QG553_286 [Patescibacteria group bacterium]|nr:hypothetical protein [Patescibacteria group bacterium]